MTALSFWQPYAWFIVNGHADVDSRTWAPPPSKIGKRIGIHATKRKVTASEFEDFLNTVNKLGIKNYPKTRDEFDYGKLVGSVVLSGVTKKSKSPFAFSGYYHWQLKNPKKIKPILVRGRQGWFTV
jgi:hypothetical protein